MIIHGDALTVLRGLDDESVHCCVTSPPYYGLRDYGLPPTMWPAVEYSPLPGMEPLHIPEWEGCLGLEPTIEMFIGHVVLIFREVRRVLKKSGTLWMNFGDSYCSTAPGTMGDNIHIKECKESTKRARKIMRPALSSGMKPKDLQGIPWRSAFALQADGWFLRQDIIWHKPNPMPEAVKDRCTKAHEYIFLLSKSRQYYYDQEAILEPISPNTHARISQDLANQIGSHRANGGTRTDRPMKAVSRKTAKGRAGIEKNNASWDQSCCMPVTQKNKRSVWTVTTQPYSEAHFATFPPELIRPCILAGCPVGGTVIDPFFGSGTTGQVALEENRGYIGIDLNPVYIEISKRRTAEVQVRMII